MHFIVVYITREFFPFNNLQLQTKQSKVSCILVNMSSFCFSAVLVNVCLSVCVSVYTYMYTVNFLHISTIAHVKIFFNQFLK